MIVIPTILTNDPAELVTLVSKAEGQTKYLQIDINDGSFLGQGYKTIDPDSLQEIDTEIFLDFHLMVREPINWVEKCVRSGGDRIIGHIERMSDQRTFIGKCQEAGVRVGLALDIDTPVENIDPSVVTDLDIILLMDYKAGVGGQEFDRRVIEKIKKLVTFKKSDPTPFSICCDGGIRMDTMKLVYEAGADEVAIGRWLFEGSVKDNISRLESFYK